MNRWISSISNSEEKSKHTWFSLCACILIGLGFFLVANLATYYASGYFQKQRDYRAQVDEILKFRNIRTLFSGDSHCAVPLNAHMNRTRNNGAYSIAFGGDSLRECFAKVRYILERYPTIDTLVVSAEPHMFGTLRLESSNRSFADYYFLNSADSAGLEGGWLSALLDQVPLLNDDFVQYFRVVLGKKLTTRVAVAKETPAPRAPCGVNCRMRNECAERAPTA